MARQRAGGGRALSRPLLALLLLVPAPSLGVVAGLVLWPGGAGRFLFAAAKVWVVALPLLWRLAVDHAPLSWSPPRRGGLGVGAAIGAVSGAAILLAFLLLRSRLDPGALRATADAMGISAPGAYLAGAATWVLVNALMEEYVWRWFVFSQLERLTTPAAAAAGSAAAFTLHHVVALQAYLGWGLVALASTGVFLGGLCWSLCYARYRSIWPGWVAHVLADVAVFAVGWMLLFG